MDKLWELFSSSEGLKFITAIGIGTIISSVISFWRDRKKSQLEYITNKRSEWRNEIR